MRQAGSRQKEFECLRAQYPVFCFDDFQVHSKPQEVRVVYRYSAGSDLSFRSTYRIDAPSSIELNQLDNFWFALGMIDMLSYWKCVCSPQVSVGAGAIDSEQQQWWRYLYYQGLSEFRYVNGIEASQEEWVSFDSSFKPAFSPLVIPSASGNLVPIGGGKDSAVTLELLGQATRDNLCFMLNDRSAADRTVIAAGYPVSSAITATRTIDPKLFELNRNGFLNGHTPFSALLAFLSTLAAALHKRRYVVLSNESSANEGNLPGLDVNHQYSKTFDFEQRFVEYCATYLTADVQYFSLLRPWNELQIAREFAHHTQHHEIFRSCNRGLKSDSWCRKCPKCLFVFVSLAPFLEMEKLCQIFGANLLDDPELHDDLRSLVDPRRLKPLECVGTRSEVAAALKATVDKYRSTGEHLPVLLQAFIKSEQYRAAAALESLLSTYSGEHRVPEYFLRLLSPNMAA